MGCKHIDNAARICHSPSTSALKQTIGANRELPWHDRIVLVSERTSFELLQKCVAEWRSFAEYLPPVVLRLQWFRNLALPSLGLCGDNGLTFIPVLNGVRATNLKELCY
ncbi:hypothetical protein [Pantanalinema sp. GBBB05]|uniref:hypothetical protein n=1 Tax=Pantanalinema sp. GBBB05 TaxID=2604139 RepID=UPI003D8143AF